MARNPDVLKMHIPSKIFREVKAAPAPVVHITDDVTGAVLTFQRAAAITRTTETQSRNRFGWPVRQWRGQPTS